ncbi:MAG: O-antigen ligase family protein [Rhodanobacteraceae bacterium]
MRAPLPTDWRPALSDWRVLVVLAVVILLPVGRAAELPIAIGALAALVLLCTRPGALFRSPGAWLVLSLFACYWIPTLVSTIGAVAPAKTWSTVAASLRFLPFALFAVVALSAHWIWRPLIAWIGIVVLFWVLDAWIQMLTGFSLGGAAGPERLSGVFGADNLKLGPVLAVLAPFVLLTARARYGRGGLAVAFMVLLVPVLLAGSRAAWVSLGLVVAMIAWQETRRWPQFLLVSALAVGCAIAAGAIGRMDSHRFDARWDRSLLALDGTFRSVNEASAGRLSIWQDALAMSRSHPLTGVGVRGFRYAYPAYATAGDRFVDRDSDTGAFHAHQIVLEILSETGVIGLILWLVGTLLAIRSWLRADQVARERARAPALALIAMCFPINSHLAFYSAWWGLLFWWLIALYCAALGARPRQKG